MLMDIANTVAGTSLDLHVSIFVTCLCNPESVPAIPNSNVTIARPSVTTLLREFMTPPSSRPSAHTASSSQSQKKLEADARSIDSESAEDVAEDVEKIPSSSARLNWVGLGGGVAVCAAGPESLTREAQNAVARMSLTRGVELGGVALHTELFAI